MELAQCHLHHTPFDFYWMIVALQRCVRFCPTAKAISYMYTCAQRFSCVQLSVTLWTVARQAPLSTGFSRQEYWSGLPCPPPGDLPHLGMDPTSRMSPTLTVGFFTTSPPRKPICMHLSSLSEKAMAPYSSARACKILWTEEPGRLQSMGSLRVGHN